MTFAHALAAAFLLAPIAASAATPLVNPVVVPLGGPSVHLTPHAYDAGGNEVPVSISQCTLNNISAALATFTYDASGAVLTAVNTGSTNLAQWKCVNGSTAVYSAPFTVSVPWKVTAIGTTSP